jgi:hypothetical protein
MRRTAEKIAVITIVKTFCSYINTEDIGIFGGFPPPIPFPKALSEENMFIPSSALELL